MISSLLSKNQCAACRYCCIFDKSDCWELPLMNDDTKRYIQQKFPKTNFELVGNMFRLSPNFHLGDLYHCAALGKNGCILPNELKPFDCKIWPFRVMKQNDNIVIALSDGCNSINELPDDVIKAFVNTDFGDKVFQYANLHHEIIKPYIDGYKIYKIFNKL